MSLTPRLPHPAPHQAAGAPLNVETSTPRTGTVVITPRGEVDVVSAPLLRRAIDEAIEEGRPHIVVDLDQVTFMDATTLDLLAQAHQHASAAGLAIRARCTASLGRMLFETVGLEELLD
jgi:anti-sigma B factor antagonist